MSESRDGLRGSVIEPLTIAASGAAVVIGSVLPWAYVVGGMLLLPGQSPDDLHAITGDGFDGEVTLALGVVAILVALMLTLRPSAVLRLVAMVLFVWASWIAVTTMDLLSPTPIQPSQMFHFEAQVVPGYGFGLIVTLIGAIGGSLVSLIWLIRALISSDSPINAPVRA